MARIPVSQRSVNLTRPPAVQVDNGGAGVGVALERLGATGVQVGLGMQAAQTRLGAEELARQQAAAAAARKARDQNILGELDDGLRDLADEIGAKIASGEVPKDAAEQTFTDRAQKLADEKLQGLSDDDARSTVQPLVGRLQAKLGNGVRKAVELRNRQDVTADMQQQLERLQRQYSADPQRSQAHAMLLFDTLGPQSVLNPVQLGDARQRWIEGAQYNVADSAVKAARHDPKAVQAAQQVMAGLEQLDPQRRTQLEDRLTGYQLAHQQRQELAAQRAARQAEARMNRARAEFETFQALADKGGMLSPEYVDRVALATAGTPYQQGVKALAQQARETGGFAAQPLSTQQAALDAIDAQIAQSGRSPELDKRREQLAKVVNASNADVSKDALRAGLERGVIDALPPLDLSNGTAGIMQSVQARVQAAQQVETWAGRAVSPMTGQEAQAFGRMLAQMAPDAKANAIGMMAQIMPGKQAQALARQIDPQDRALSLAMAAGASQTTEGRFTAELILRGQAALRDKTVKLDTSAEIGLRAQLAAELGDAIEGQARADVLDTAQFIHAGKQAAQERVSVGGALRLAIGGDLIEHAGRKVPVPAGMDEQSLREKLMRMPERAISQQAPDGFVYIPGGRPMGVPEFLAALPSAQLEPVGLGRYAVRSGGGLVLNSQRRPIVVDVR